MRIVFVLLLYVLLNISYSEDEMSVANCLVDYFAEGKMLTRGRWGWD